MMTRRALQKRNKRIQHVTPITLEDRRTGYHYSGILQNYSNSGLYFKSSYAQRPGRRIRIKSDNLPFKNGTGEHLAEVIWRKLVTQERSTHSFGVGAKFC
jgi:hypothetical protein